MKQCICVLNAFYSSLYQICKYLDIIQILHTLHAESNYANQNRGVGFNFYHSKSKDDNLTLLYYFHFCRSITGVPRQTVRDCSAQLQST